MPTRSRAREIAMQAVYQADMNAAMAPEDIARFLDGRLKARGLVAFARGLVDGVVCSLACSLANQARLNCTA